MLALLGIGLGAQIVVGTAAVLFMLLAGHGFDYKAMEPAALGKLMAALYFCSMSLVLAGILYYRRARGGAVRGRVSRSVGSTLRCCCGPSC